jgi:hypothetical protein
MTRTLKGSSKQAAPTKIAPDLAKILSQVQADSAPLAVVYQLRGPEGQTVPQAETMDGLVQRIIDSASKEAQVPALRQNTFRHLGSFVVLADPELHRAVIRQPEIQAAVLNQSSKQTP